MPTADGPIGNPRYDVNDPPKFPVHLTEISDFFADLAEPVTNYSDLAGVPAKFDGMLKGETQTDGLYRWNGAAWQRMNRLIDANFDTYSSTATNDGTVAITFVFAALPFSTRILLTADGQMGFKSGASAGNVSWTASAGSLNQSPSNNNNMAAAQFQQVGQVASLELAANTASTVRLVVGASNQPYTRVGAHYQRFATA